MKPWQTLATANTPDGGRLELVQRDQEFVIRVNGDLLMSSRTHASEEAMAEAACAGLAHARPRLLVGGLGFGYTLRAILDRVGPGAKVLLAELSQSVIDWNRGPLAGLAGHPLDDRRVTVKRCDVRRLIVDKVSAYDGILLDVDNGPQALTSRSNRDLYQPDGIAAVAGALKPGGVVVIWSAGPDSRFADRLRAAGLRVEVREEAARPRGKGAWHTLFIAHKLS